MKRLFVYLSLQAAIGVLVGLAYVRWFVPECLEGCNHPACAAAHCKCAIGAARSKGTCH